MRHHRYRLNSGYSLPVYNKARALLKTGLKFKAVRHDSGDPFSFGDEIIKLYKNYKIDPLTKSIVFSDGLNIPKALELLEYFAGRIKVSFGIGTNLTNDVGITPLNIVIKMVECNGRPIAKLSDTSGKTVCEDVKYLEYLKDNVSHG